MQPFDPTPDSATRVLVADQNPTVRASLRAFVEAEPGLKFVGDAGDAHWLLWALRVAQPDVLVVDCLLPGGHLPGIVEHVREQRPDARIVILGSGEWLAPSTQVAGADAYVSKCESPDVLRAALRMLDDRRN